MTASGVDRALVLAAGRATRLRPLSAVRAKAAMPVAGRPLLRRLLEQLAAHGVRDVVVNLHHLPHTITAVVGDGADLGVRVRYSWEPRLLGTAGGVRHALALVDADRFFIVNGDTLSNVALDRLAAHHLRLGAQVTLALIPNPDPTRYGGVDVDDGWVTGFAPPGAAPRYHFVGIQVVEAAVFAPLADHEAAESVSQVYPALLTRHPRAIAAFVSDAGFRDIGTPADYLATSLAVAREEGAAPHPVSGEIPAGHRCRLAPTARLVRTALWDEVTVEADVELTDCIVADGVRVPAGSRWARQVLVPASAVAPGPGLQRVGGLIVAPLG